MEGGVRMALPIAFGCFKLRLTLNPCRLLPDSVSSLDRTKRDEFIEEPLILFDAEQHRDSDAVRIDDIAF